MEKQP